VLKKLRGLLEAIVFCVAIGVIVKATMHYFNITVTIG
jgi:hypothetical protein